MRTLNNMKAERRWIEIIAVVAFGFICNVAASSEPPEAVALLSLRQSLLPPGSERFLTDWSFDPVTGLYRYCDWTGITCAPNSDRVIGISLTGKDIGPFPGSIPSNLFSELPDLAEWSLFNTNVTGRFPDVTPASNLRRLINFRNNFTDWTAPDWSELDDIFYVDFAKNSLQMFMNLNDFNLTTASTPKLNQLTLRLHSNLIQGDLDDPVVLQQFSSIGDLTLYDNPCVCGGTLDALPISIFNTKIGDRCPIPSACAVQYKATESFESVTASEVLPTNIEQSGEVAQVYQNLLKYRQEATVSVISNEDGEFVVDFQETSLFTDSLVTSVESSLSLKAASFAANQSGTEFSPPGPEIGSPPGDSTPTSAAVGSGARYSVRGLYYLPFCPDLGDYDTFVAIENAIVDTLGFDTLQLEIELDPDVIDCGDLSVFTPALRTFNSFSHEVQQSISNGIDPILNPVTPETSRGRRLKQEDEKTLIKSGLNPMQGLTGNPDFESARLSYRAFVQSSDHVMDAVSRVNGLLPTSRERSNNVPNNSRNIPSINGRKLKQSLTFEDSRSVIELEEPITVDFTTAILWPEGSSTNDVCAFGNLAEDIIGDLATDEDVDLDQQSVTYAVLELQSPAVINPTQQVIQPCELEFSCDNVSSNEQSFAELLSLISLGVCPVTDKFLLLPDDEPLIISIKSDPHINGLSGQSFDFTGRADKIYNLLSDKYLNINALFGTAYTTAASIDSTTLMVLPYHSKGTWIRSLGFLIRPTNEEDELTSIEVSTTSKVDRFDLCPQDPSARTKACLLVGSVVVDRNMEINKIGELDITDHVKLTLTNSKTYSKIALSTPWIDCQINVVLPPVSWQIPDSEIDDFTHIDFQIDRLRVADRLNIHGVLGQTASNRFLPQNSPLSNKSSASNGEGIIDGRPADYEVPTILYSARPGFIRGKDRARKIRQARRSHAR